MAKNQVLEKGQPGQVADIRAKQVPLKLHMCSPGELTGGGQREPPLMECESPGGPPSLSQEAPIPARVPLGTEPSGNDPPRAATARLSSSPQASGQGPSRTHPFPPSPLCPGQSDLLAPGYREPIWGRTASAQRKVLSWRKRLVHRLCRPRRAE